VQTYKRSWQTDERLIRIHLLPRIGRMFMDEVTTEHLQQMLARMKDAGYAPGTCARPIIIARYMFSLAKKWKVPGISDNPASGFPLPQDVQRNRFLTENEVERLLQALHRDLNQAAAKAILLLLLTGARRNEITQARWQHVDLDKGRLFVPLSKSGKPRFVVLNNAAQEVIRSIQRTGDNPFVFPSAVTGRPSPSLFFPWSRVRRTAAIPDVRLHDLRHSFASLLVNRDVPLYKIQKLLGHSNLKTTQRYAHLEDEQLDRAAETIGQLVEKLNQAKPDDDSGSGSE
jgi:integrase